MSLLAFLGCHHEYGCMVTTVHVATNPFVLASAVSTLAPSCAEPYEFSKRGRRLFIRAFHKRPGVEPGRFGFQVEGSVGFRSQGRRVGMDGFRVSCREEKGLCLEWVAPSWTASRHLGFLCLGATCLVRVALSVQYVMAAPFILLLVHCTDRTAVLSMG